MSRLNDENVLLAKEIIARYPKARSATIPLLHLSQQQNGYVTQEAMTHIADLVGATAAEVQGTATFYEMFKFHPVGAYLVNICGTMSCQLMGSEELLHHAEQTLGIKAGSTTPDGMFTLEHAECQAACTEAPNMQINYRHCHRMTPNSFDQLIEDLRGGHRTDDFPQHGTLARVRQSIPSDKAAGVVAVDSTDAPVWLPPAEVK
jgi:NADH-quinone oxidoreductase subunit E